MRENFSHKVYRDDIITSMFDIDAYKIHMQQVVYEKYPTVEVEYSFIDRNKEGLAEYLGEIIQEINKLENLRFTDDQIDFLHKRVPWLKYNFIEFLRDFRLDPKRYVRATDNNGQLEIRVKGPWLKTIYFEIFILAIVSEVRNRNKFAHIPHEQFRKTMLEKIKYCKKEIERRGIRNFKFVEYGTRRRASYHMQSDAIDMLIKHMPDEFLGTSNYHIAKEKQIQFHGTVAHEYFAAHQVLMPLATHQNDALKVWDEVFEGNLGVALTDTITTESFLKGFNLGLANRFTGLRQDSGNPFNWGEMVIDKYKDLGIDPLTKKLFFTDSLNFEKALDLAERFQDEATVMFGMGTFLSNDFGDYKNEDGVQYKPLNIVMKLVTVNGQPVAKISDEPAKSVCECPYHLANLKARFGVDVDNEKLIKELKEAA